MTETAAPPVTLRETRAQRPPRWEVWLAAWPVTAVFVLSNAATPLYVLWQREFGFASGTLTMVFACYMVGLVGALMVAGTVSDRIGRKPVLLPAVVLGIVACVLFGTASSVLALGLARLLTGIAVGSLVSAGMAAVSDVGGPSRRRLAALLASTGMVLGAGLGPLLAGLFSETLPEPTVTVFVVEAALLIIALVAVWRMPLPARDGAGGGRSWVRLPSVPRVNRIHLVLGIAVFAPGITATSFVLSLGPSLLSGLLATENRIIAGGMAFVMFAAATGVQLAVQRLEIPAILLTGAFSTTASMGALILAVHTSSVVALVAAAVLAGSGQGLGQFGGLTLIGSSVPPTRLAEANAALNTGGYVAAGSIPVATGFLSDHIGLSAGTTVFGVVMIGMALSGAAVVFRNRYLVEEDVDR